MAWKSYLGLANIQQDNTFLTRVSEILSGARVESLLPCPGADALGSITDAL